MLVLARVVAIPVVLATLGACAYPKKVKDAASAELDLIREIRTTARLLEKAQVDSLERTAILKTESFRALRAAKLLKAGCAGHAETQKCSAEGVRGSLRESGATAPNAALKARDAIVDQFTVLDLQLQLEERAAATIKDYVDTDVKIDDKKLEKLKDQAAKIAPEEKPAENKDGGGS